MDAVSAVSTRSPQEHYCAACSSPLLAPYHCELISRAVVTYTTPAQVSEIAASMKECIESGLSAMEDEPNDGDAIKGAGPRKKRQVAPKGQFRDDRAASFALTLPIVSLALTSLPVELLQRSARDELRLRLVEGTHSLLRTCLKRTVKAIRTGTPEHTWGWAVVGAAMIRLDYNSSAVHREWPQYISQDRSKIFEQLWKLYNLETIPSTLFVFVVRNSMFRSSFTTHDDFSVVHSSSWLDQIRHHHSRRSTKR
jgi:hypothetical protein